MKAFPTVNWVQQHGQPPNDEGMDLRDYFASKALQGMLASPNCDTEVNVVVISRHAYLIGDAMIKERERKDEQV